MNEPVGFRQFVAEQSPGLLRAAWLLTGDRATPGTLTGGVIVVEPFAQGYKVLQVTLPASQSAQLRAILKSLYSG